MITSLCDSYLIVLYHEFLTNKDYAREEGTRVSKSNLALLSKSLNIVCEMKNI